MWAEFALALVAGALLLYVPGHLFFRGLGLSPTLALCCAPLFGTCLYAGLPIIYFELGIPCSVPTVVGPALLVAAVVPLAARLLGRRRRAGELALSPQRPVSIGGAKVPFDALVLALFVALSALVCAFVFLRALPSPDAFVQRNDNQTHLNLTRSFLESGKWSSLHNSSYLASPASARPGTGDGKFYPSAWMCLVALMCLLGGARITVAANAAVALCSAVVFPAGMYAFLRVLLPRERRAIALGAVAVTGFANCPWHYVYTGPLFPNQLGISLQFAAMGGLILFVESGELRRRAAAFAAFGAASFVALTLAHPTTIFSAYVFLASYGAHVLRCALRGRRRRLVLLGYAGALAAFWAICYQLPMLQNVLSWVEHEQAPVPKVLYDLLGLGFGFTYAQLGMLACVVAGIVALWRKREIRWVVGPILFFAIGYVATRTHVEPLRYWMTALWYSDRRRLAMNVALFLMPVAALGLDAILPARLPRRNGERTEGTQAAASRAVTVARFGCFFAILALVYLPALRPPASASEVRMPLAFAERRLENRFAEQIYSTEEVAFVRRVLGTIPPGALVVNYPADGSMWAYGAEGLNTFFRFIFCGGERDDVVALRERLCDYATDPAVRAAVEHVDAHYVLLLDKGVRHEDGHWLWQFTEDQERAWRGIADIGDDTPGFTVVLSEGDEMRLYRIDRP